eukprot:Gb_14591 [translate_table: standard]
MIFTDHQALKFINSQEKLNVRHSKWVETLRVSLSHFDISRGNPIRGRCLEPLNNDVNHSTEVTDFTLVKEQYETDKDFQRAWSYAKNPVTDSRDLFDKYFLQDGYLFKGK